MTAALQSIQDSGAKEGLKRCAIPGDIRQGMSAASSRYMLQAGLTSVGLSQ